MNHIGESSPSLIFEFVHEPDHEILGPSGRRNDAIGEGLLQFRRSSSRFLRAREVFFQSGGATDRHGAADPNELPGFCVENFFILEIENLFPYFHPILLCAGDEKGNRAVAFLIFHF